MSFIKLYLSERSKVSTQAFASLMVLFALLSAYMSTPGLIESLRPMSEHKNKRLPDIPTWPAVGLSLVAIVPGVFLFMNLRHNPLFMQDELMIH